MSSKALAFQAPPFLLLLAGCNVAQAPLLRGTTWRDEGGLGDGGLVRQAESGGPADRELLAPVAKCAIRLFFVAVECKCYGGAKAHCQALCGNLRCRCAFVQAAPGRGGFLKEIWVQIRAEDMAWLGCCVMSRKLQTPV